MNLRFTAPLLALVLASCATPYSDDDPRNILLGGGVESTWRSPQVLAVSARGNAYSSVDRIKNFTMLHASEKAMEVGYSYFVLIDEADTSRIDTFTTYSPVETEVSGSLRSYGNTSVFSGNATTTGGEQITRYFKPGREVLFFMSEEPPQGFRPGQYFIAVEVYNELGDRYIRGFTPIASAEDWSRAKVENEE